jgi:hypothetical protein
MAIGSPNPLGMTKARNSKRSFRGVLLVVTPAMVLATSPVLGTHRDQMLWSGQQCQQLRTEIDLLDWMSMFPVAVADDHAAS